MNANTNTPWPADEVARLQEWFGWDRMTAERHLRSRNLARDAAESKRAEEARAALAWWAARRAQA